MIRIIIHILEILLIIIVFHLIKKEVKGSLKDDRQDRS